MNEKSENKNAVNQDRDAGPSRRNFLAPVAAAAAVAAVIRPTNLMAAAATIPSITIPKEITDSVNEPSQVGSFEGRGMSGAEVFAKACKEENLAALFCCL